MTRVEAIRKGGKNRLEGGVKMMQHKQKNILS